MKRGQVNEAAVMNAIHGFPFLEVCMGNWYFVPEKQTMVWSLARWNRVGYTKRKQNI
jgi:hypothetical protein